MSFAEQKNEIRSRIFPALNASRGALSVSFPRLPATAFETLAASPDSGLRFFFENEKKGVAVAAFSSSVPDNVFPRAHFRELKKKFPRKRTEISVADDGARVPAPKIFAVGNFENPDEVFATLPVWQLSREGNFSRLCAHVFVEPADAARTADTLVEEFFHFKKIAETPIAPCALPSLVSLGEVGGDRYSTRGVADSLAEIDAGNFEKIVLARAKDFSVSETKNFFAGAVIPALRERFFKSECTIFFVADGTRECVGASPETLARVVGSALETEALAGTAAANASPDEFLRDEKESREHRFVLDFIVEKLRALGLAPRFSASPETLLLPNVRHLRTPIFAEIPDGKIGIGDVVAALHPTPAMCGIPADAARRFIAKTEPFRRGIFSSPVGFIEAGGNGFFAVAIRCAEIFEKKIRLYGASGIVRGSRPEKESAEIDAKISAMTEIFAR